MSKSTNTMARERLEALVGEWTIEAGPSGGPPRPGGGRITFEWLDGVPLVIERSHVDVPESPDGVAVSCDGMSDTYYQLYTDEQDVQRVCKPEFMQDSLKGKEPISWPFAEPSDGLEPSTPSLPCAPNGKRSQPTATVFACFCAFRGRPTCDRLPAVATTGLRKGSIPWKSIEATLLVTDLPWTRALFES